jgi:hypothetical protein
LLEPPGAHGIPSYRQVGVGIWGFLAGAQGGDAFRDAPVNGESNAKTNSATAMEFLPG